MIADIKRMALRRAHLPPKDVDFLHLLDDDAPTIVRTPFALSIWKKSKYAGFLHYYRAFRTHGSFFFPRAGVGQGDVPSPHIWNLVMDILLRALEHHRLHNPSSSGIPVRASDGIHPVTDLVYADDIISLSVSHFGLQSLANLVSLFANIFGLTISLLKLRAFYGHYSERTLMLKTLHYYL